MNFVVCIIMCSKDTQSLVPCQIQDRVSESVPTLVPDPSLMSVEFRVASLLG